MQWPNETIMKASGYQRFGSIVELAHLEAIEAAMKYGERVSQRGGRQHLLLAELVPIEQNLHRHRPHAHTNVQLHLLDGEEDPVGGRGWRGGGVATLRAQ